MPETRRGSPNDDSQYVSKLRPPRVPGMGRVQGGPFQPEAAASVNSDEGEEPSWRQGSGAKKN